MLTLPVKPRYRSVFRSLAVLLAVAACGSPQPPVLTSTSPADNAVDVPLNAKLSVQFGTPMRELTAVAGLALAADRRQGRRGELRGAVGAAAHFEGVVLCKTEVTLQTGATMNGRIPAQTQVALQQGTVTQPAL